jgi:lysozyme family protein
MDERFSECLAFTLRAEGGYVDNPDDPGGATNMGVTLATYRTWSDDPSAGVSQIRDITKRVAGAIYRTLYWHPVRGDALPVGVDLSVFDFGVNAGVWRSGRMLQLALGFSGDAVDGCIGPETLAAAVKADAQTLIEALSSRQATYYRSLPDYPIFGQGWLNRTEARRDAALAMLDSAATLNV